jgi:hypothetical protein
LLAAACIAANAYKCDRVEREDERSLTRHFFPFCPCVGWSQYTTQYGYSTRFGVSRHLRLRNPNPAIAAEGLPVRSEIDDLRARGGVDLAAWTEAVSRSAHVFLGPA